MTNYYQYFNRDFFEKHQEKLLWLLNTPIISRWFRYVLRISSESSSVEGRYIDRILPHAIFWWQGDKHVAEFRTHAKFSKRLYYAFAPLWWAMHGWDWAVADRWMPELSFGFSTLTKYPDAHPETDTVDGYVANPGEGQTWANLVSAAGASSGDTIAAEGIWFTADTPSNTWWNLGRVIFLYNTSSLTSAAIISSVVMSLYGESKGDDLSVTPNVNIYTSSPASNTALVSGDYDSFGTTAQCDTSITYAGWSIAGYNNFTLNSTGIGNISKVSITKFGMRNANYDVAANAPTWAAGNPGSWLTCYHADQTGTTNDPKLVVTYTFKNQLPLYMPQFP